MAGALEITAKQVEDLQGGGGIPFREFMKQLIRIHGYALGFRVADVISDSENMSDGGCDTEVRRGNGSDPTGFCREPTCWQFKGTEKSKLSDRILRKEVHKKYARALIEKGYVYCLCVADDLTAQDVAKLRDILDDEIRKNINASAPASIVMGSTVLAEWASRYPGFALARIGKTTNLLSISAWGSSATAETRRYVENPEWQNAKDVLARHVDFTFESPTVTVRLRGDAGVGKTRLVYETIKGIPGSDQLCLYTMHENAVIEFAYFLGNAPEMFAIIIADECLNKTRQQLEQILGGCKDRVRVIVINNTDEQSYQPSPEPELNKLPNEILEQILKENFPATPQEDRRAALDLAEGFVRIAADLCKHGVSQGVGHLTAYVDSRVRDAEKARTLEAISLFERVGWKDEFTAELGAVAKVVGVTDQQLLQSALAIKNASPGFIVIAGRYLYVSPEAVAQICFARGWEKWVSPDVRRFYTSLPEQLAESFQLRVRKSASDKVREEFAIALQEIADDFRIDDLADKKKAEQFLRLVETNPTRFLPRLRAIIDSAPSELLSRRESSLNSWGIRRQLVWTCEHLAQFPEFFHDVEATLLRLAILETEPKIGNNASAIWRQLFRLYLPGTAVPFRERIALLKKRFRGRSQEVALLALGAVEGSFSRNVTRMGGPAVVAGRIPPADWHPRTDNEEYECFSSVLELLRDALRDTRKDVNEHAVQLFLRNIRFVLARGFYQFVREATEEPQLRTGYLPQILDQIDDFLKFDAPHFDESYVQAVENWKSSLLPDHDLFAKLEVLVGRSHRWKYEEPERQGLQHEIAALARELIEQSALSDAALDWLSSEKATQAFEFGADVGRLDQKFDLFEPIKSRATASNSAFIRGYIFGVVEKQSTLPSNISHWLDDLEVSDPQLLYAIASSIPLQVNGFDRVMRLFEDKKIPPRYLNGLQFRIGRGNFSREQLARMLRALLAYRADDRQQALATAVDVTASWNEDRQAGEKNVLSDPNVWPLIRSIIEQATPEGTMDVYHWSNLLRAASATEPTLVVNRCVEAIGEALYISEQATSILIEIARSEPALIMASLGRLILDEKRGWKLQITGVRGLLSALPDEVVVEWLNQHGVEAARKIASSLPRPFLSAQGEPQVPSLTQRVLELFGDDEKVTQRFAAPAGFRSYSGDIVRQHREEARFAEKFLNHPLKPVRFWAQVERQSSLAEAERWKREIEEKRW